VEDGKGVTVAVELVTEVLRGVVTLLPSNGVGVDAYVIDRCREVCVKNAGGPGTGPPFEIASKASSRCS
jgi:hypothetical protein